MITRIILTAITGIGGHYLNRRWDRAILFFCLFLLFRVGSYAILFLLFQIFPSWLGENIATLNNTINVLWQVSSWGIFILWGISLLLTIKDSRTIDTATHSKWTTSGITGAVLTSLLSFIFLGATFMGSYVHSRPFTHSQSVSMQPTPASMPPSGFFETLYFGGGPTNPFNLPEPPSGADILKGRIRYQNKPAAGVSLSLVLNGKYRIKGIVTDKDGIFTLHLPPGTWAVNSIETRAWENKPDANGFTLYYGGEEKLTGTSYNRYAGFHRTGYPVTVGAKPSDFQLDLVIANDIRLQWPDPNAKQVDAAITDQIRWKKYPQASKYYVAIEKITREKRRTSYQEVTSKILTKTTLSLSSLKHRKLTEKKKQEYAANIYAFAKDGTLIGQFTDTFRGGTFLLSDGNILLKDDLDDQFGLSSIEDPKEFEQKMNKISLNERRATAVSILLDEKMLPEAESLAKRIDSQYARGRKEVLLGYIFALKGRCAKAAGMFDKARGINPNTCINDKYQQDCYKKAEDKAQKQLSQPDN